MERRGPTWTKRFFLILLGLTKDGELPGKLDIGKPGFKEIGAEGNEKIGFVDAIVRYLGGAEDDLIRLPQRLVRKGLVDECTLPPTASAHRRAKSCSVPVMRWDMKTDLPCPAPLKPSTALLQGFLPRNGNEAAAAIPCHGLPVPVRIV